MAVKHLLLVCLVSAIYSQANGKAWNTPGKQSKPGSTFLDYGKVRCNYDYPISCDSTNYCCPTNAPICCGDETCCPNDHPFCSDGLCYASAMLSKSKCVCCLPYLIVTMVLMLLVKRVTRTI